MYCRVGVFGSLRSVVHMPVFCCAIVETGVQSLALMILTVTLVFRGCQQGEVLAFVLCASLYYVFHSVWIVIFLRCCCMDFCNKTCDRDGDSEPVKFCGECKCCLPLTEIHADAKPVEPSSLSRYGGIQQFKTADGTAEMPIRLSQSG